MIGRNKSASPIQLGNRDTILRRLPLGNTFYTWIAGKTCDIRWGRVAAVFEDLYDHENL